MPISSLRLWPVSWAIASMRSTSSCRRRTENILTLRLFGPNDQLVMVAHERTSQITTFYSKSPGISYARISVIAVVTDMVSIRYLFEVVDMR